MHRQNRFSNRRCQIHNEKLRRWRIEYTKSCIDLAKEVSATNVSITSGKSMLGKPPEEAVELFKDSLARFT